MSQIQRKWIETGIDTSNAGVGPRQIGNDAFFDLGVSVIPDSTHLIPPASNVILRTGDSSMLANLNMGGNKVVNATAVPSSDGDLINLKFFNDNAVTFSWKQEVGSEALRDATYGTATDTTKIAGSLAPLGPQDGWMVWTQASNIIYAFVDNTYAGPGGPGGNWVKAGTTPTVPYATDQTAGKLFLANNNSSITFIDSTAGVVSGAVRADDSRMWKWTSVGPVHFVNNDVTINGDTDISGNAFIGGSLQIDGTSTLSRSFSRLFIVDESSISINANSGFITLLATDNVFIQPDTTISGNVLINSSDALHFRDSNATIQSDLANRLVITDATNITISANTGTLALTAGDHIFVQPDTTISGNVLIGVASNNTLHFRDANASIYSDIPTRLVITDNSNITVQANNGTLALIAGDHVSIQPDTTVLGALDVNGGVFHADSDATFAANLLVANHMPINFVDSNANIHDDFAAGSHDLKISVAGASGHRIDITSSGDMGLNTVGTLTVTGGTRIQLVGDTTVSGVASISNGAKIGGNTVLKFLADTTNLGSGDISNTFVDMTLPATVGKNKVRAISTVGYDSVGTAHVYADTSNLSPTDFFTWGEMTSTTNIRVWFGSGFSSGDSVSYMLTYSA